LRMLGPEVLGTEDGACPTAETHAPQAKAIVSAFFAMARSLTVSGFRQRLASGRSGR
jgi:hypothetical protein